MNERIEIKTGEQGEISIMVVNPVGARIEELQLAGVKILTSVARGDGKQASSHPCTPIFGPETTTNYGLPQHGPMRNDECRFEAVGDHVDLYHEIDCGTYPKGLTVVQRLSLFSRLFSQVTNHINNGEDPAPVNFGEHLYWSAPEGWERLKINGKDVTDAVKSDEVIGLDRTNEIKIPGQPTIFLVQEGLPYANLWVYKNVESGQFDGKYVCIEPVELDPRTNPFGRRESMIATYSVRTCRFSIHI